MKKTFIDFLLDFRSHAGFPMLSIEDRIYFYLIARVDYDEAFQTAMILQHKYYPKNKTWKSYDW